MGGMNTPWANMNFLSKPESGVVRMQIESSLPGTAKVKVVIISDLELKRVIKLRNILDAAINQIVEST
jgi:hypothetical protein